MLLCGREESKREREGGAKESEESKRERRARERERRARERERRARERGEQERDRFSLMVLHTRKTAIHCRGVIPTLAFLETCGDQNGH